MFTLVARLYGLEADFDADYPPSGTAFPFRLSDAGWKDAIRGLEAATSSFVLPTSERRLLVVKDTPQKRQEREPYISVTIPIPDTISAQETQELTNAVRTVAQLTRLGFDMTRRTIVVRDRASVVLPAQALIEQLLRRRTVVSIEIELVEADQSLSSSYGVTIPTSFPLAYFGGVLRSVPTTPSGFVNFLTFGGGKTLFGFGLLSAQVGGHDEPGDRSDAVSDDAAILGRDAREHPGGGEVPDRDRQGDRAGRDDDAVLPAQLHASKIWG